MLEIKNIVSSLHRICNQTKALKTVQTKTQEAMLVNRKMYQAVSPSDTFDKWLRDCK